MAVVLLPPLPLRAILPHLHAGELLGIPARVLPQVGEPRGDLTILSPPDLLRLRRPRARRRYLLTGVLRPPGEEWLCRARALAAGAGAGVLGWPARALVAWCDSLLLPGRTGLVRSSCRPWRRAARLRIVGSGPGHPPFGRSGLVRPLGAGRVEAELPLAALRPEEILSTWLAAGWRVEASAVVYPGLEAALEGAGPEDSFRALAGLPDRYRYDRRDAPAHAP